MGSETSGSTNEKAKRRFHAVLAAIAFVSCLATLPALPGPWILDDVPLIAQNPWVQRLGADTLRFLFTHDMWDLDVGSSQLTPHLAYYRPLVMLSYALDWQLGAGATASYHVTNALLHALTVLQAGRALWRWSKSSAGATLGALYFGLHPARTESVAWISGRPDILGTLSLLVCIEGVSAIERERRVGVVAFAAGTVAAFLSKETALLLPLLVAIELAASGRKLAHPANWLRARPLVASAMACAVYLALRQVLLPMRPFAVEGLGWVTHAGFILETIGRGAMYMLAPFDLSFFGPLLTERDGAVAPNRGYLAAGAVALVAVLAVAWWSRTRKPRAFWALLAFAIACAPTLNIVWIGGIGLTGARFFYLPALLFAWFATELARGAFKAASQRILVFTGAAAALAFTLLYALQAARYRSADAFWSDELQSRPDAPPAIEYFARRDLAHGDLERGLARSLCEYDIVQQRFSFRGEGARIVLLALDAWASGVPDAARADLRALAAFLHAASAPHGPATLDRELTLDIPESSKVRRELVRSAPIARTQEAAIRVRLGQRDEAVELVERARAACPRCRDLFEAQARVAYRAFDPDLATRLALPDSDERWGKNSKSDAIARLRELNAAIARAGGAARIELETQRYAELGLFGEGLTLLQGVAERNPEAAASPDFARAMLAFAARAGDAETTALLARRLGIAAPPPKPSLSVVRVKQYMAELRDGCAFPDER